jgi:hypothetical protein
MREPPVEHLDQAWPGIGRTAIQQVADERGAAVGTYGVLPVATRVSSGHFISRLLWSDADDEGPHEC